jgi:hypothetical protein
MRRRKTFEDGMCCDRLEEEGDVFGDSSLSWTSLTYPPSAQIADSMRRLATFKSSGSVWMICCISFKRKGHICEITKRFNKMLETKQTNHFTHLMPSIPIDTLMGGNQEIRASLEYLANGSQQIKGTLGRCTAGTHRRGGRRWCIGVVRRNLRRRNSVASVSRWRGRSAPALWMSARGDFLAWMCGMLCMRRSAVV